MDQKRPIPTTNVLQIGLVTNTDQVQRILDRALDFEIQSTGASIKTYTTDKQIFPVEIRSLTSYDKTIFDFQKGLDGLIIDLSLIINPDETFAPRLKDMPLILFNNSRLENDNRVIWKINPKSNWKVWNYNGIKSMAQRLLDEDGETLTSFFEQAEFFHYQDRELGALTIREQKKRKDIEFEEPDLVKYWGENPQKEEGKMEEKQGRNKKKEQKQEQLHPAYSNREIFHDDDPISKFYLKAEGKPERKYKNKNPKDSKKT